MRRSRVYRDLRTESEFFEWGRKSRAMAKILVIDDDPMMLELYREILTA